MRPARLPLKPKGARAEQLHMPAGLASRIADGIVRLVRGALSEPPRPPLPGASLEPGFRRRWLCFFLPGAFVFFWLLTLAIRIQLADSWF